MNKFIDYLRESGYVSAELVHGPNGNFVAAFNGKGLTTYYPIGKMSLACTNIADFNYVVSEDGQIIATINDYSTLDVVKL